MTRKPSHSEKMIRSDYSDYTDSLESRAETDCNGFLYSRKGKDAYANGKITQYDLFTRPWHYMKAYASEELIEFFRFHGRITFTDYRAQMRESRVA